MNTSLKTAPVHAIGFACLFLLAGLTYWLAVAPVNQADRQPRTVLDESQALIAQVDEQEKENELLRREIAEKLATLDAKYCYPTKDQPLLETISQLLAAHRLELQNLSEQSTLAARQRFSLELQGSYRGFVEFLHALRQLDQPVRVCGFRLTAHDQERKTLAVHQLVLEFSARTSFASSLTPAGGNDGHQS